MSQSPTEDRDRWRELHELLGLPSEQSAPSEVEPITPPVPSSSEPVPVSRALSNRSEAIVPETPEALAVRTPEEEELMADVPPREVVLEEEQEDVPLPEGDVAGVRDRGDREEFEGGRRRRGRRGRRGRRSRGRDDLPRERPIELDDSDVPLEEPGEDLSPRNDEEEFRPHQAEPVPELDDSAELIDEEPASAADTAEDDDDEAADVFADWNVPSWQEIVASLYRPER